MQRSDESQLNESYCGATEVPLTDEPVFVRKVNRERRSAVRILRCGSRDSTRVASFSCRSFDCVGRRKTTLFESLAIFTVGRLIGAIERLLGGVDTLLKQHARPRKLDVKRNSLVCFPTVARTNLRSPAKVRCDLLSVSKPEVAQTWMIVGPTSLWPTKLALAFLDRKIIDARDAATHVAELIKFPVFVAI